MARLMWVFCFLAMWAFVHAAGAANPSDAPAPATDCSSSMMDMADCVSFVLNGSTESKPTKDCCSGFKKVLQSDPICLCESYKNSNNLGVTLNMTRAMQLPKACGLPVSVGNCDGIPTAAPGKAPVPSPSGSPSSTTSPVAPATAGDGAAAQAPSPSQSDAVASSSSILMVAICLAAAMLSYN